jgi:tRNA G18 (ribose-2'-O)-methylase SpoU
MHLTGPGDPRAAAYRDIPDPQLLRAHGLFIAEGRLIVERLLTLPRFRVRSVLLNDAAHAALRETLLAPRAAEVDVLIASAADITAIGGYDFHRGCLALVERPAPLTLEDLRLSDGEREDAHEEEQELEVEHTPHDHAEADANVPAPARPRADVIVVLEGIGNADNVGGIFRNAAALGARAVVLGPRCCDPLYRKATRTSMGATLIVPYATVSSPRGASERHEDATDARASGQSWPDTLARLRALGYRLVALTPHPPAVHIETFVATHALRGDRAAGEKSGGEPRARIALLVGAEGAGLSDEALAAATDRVVIPMTGRVDSLNVATATGIALHRLTTLG